MPSPRTSKMFTPLHRKDIMLNREDAFCGGDRGREGQGRRRWCSRHAHVLHNAAHLRAVHCERRSIKGRGVDEQLQNVTKGGFNDHTAIIHRQAAGVDRLATRVDLGDTGREDTDRLAHRQSLNGGECAYHQAAASNVYAAGHDSCAQFPRANLCDSGHIQRCAVQLSVAAQ